MYRENEFLECASHAILLANVLFITATFPNPPALRAAPFTKGGFWVPSFIKGGTGRISPAVSPCSRLRRAKPCFVRYRLQHGCGLQRRKHGLRTPQIHLCLSTQLKTPQSTTLH